MQSDIIHDLGGGLVLRRSTAGDADKLADFQAEVQRDPDAQEPEIHVATWTRDLRVFSGTSRRRWNAAWPNRRWWVTQENSG